MRRRHHRKDSLSGIKDVPEKLFDFTGVKGTDLPSREEIQLLIELEVRRKNVLLHPNGSEAFGELSETLDRLDQIRGIGLEGSNS